MGDLTIEPALSARVEVVMHDAACACDGPHTPEDDVDINYSYDDVRKAVSAARRISVAEELRRLAVKYKTAADKERNRSIRLEASGAPKWQHEASIASAQELMAFVRDLHTRANELDPEGAQR